MNQETIEKNIDNVLIETNFSELGEKASGKVRDIYTSDDQIIMIATDRYSAFDRVLASVPFKGQVLTQTSAWWFDKTKDIIPNVLKDVPDPNVVVAQKTDVLPVEMVVRGYLTGVTATSIWTNYQNGQREFGGLTLPDNMKKNQPLPKNIITPTTKFEEHDRNLTPKQILEEKMMTQEDWDYVSTKALELFAFGQKIAAERGLILVDTKYEFGRTKDGKIVLIDEIHTPDSSRWWIKTSYDQRLSDDQEPEYYDKEFLRLWFKENSDPYRDEKMPSAPPEMIVELSKRYITMYETITGQKFVHDDTPIQERIKNNLQQGGYLV